MHPLSLAAAPKSRTRAGPISSTPRGAVEVSAKQDAEAWVEVVKALAAKRGLTYDAVGGSIRWAAPWPSVRGARID